MANLIPEIATTWKNALIIIAPKAQNPPKEIETTAAFRGAGAAEG
jgi:hypothetical protein